MARTSVGILRGGTSREYDLSLKTGSAMLNALPENSYDTRDIFIDKSGMWHLRGTPVDASRALSQIDVVLNGLHGGVGEDGTVQRILERAGVPYAGSRALPSSHSLNKNRAADILLSAGLRMPRAVSFTLSNDLTTGEMALAVFAEFGPPYIVKPLADGASAGIRTAATLVELPDAIGDVLDESGNARVEEYIRGQDASVGIIENFRDQELYALPPAHMIAPQGAKFIDFDSHHAASIVHIVPSHFSHLDKQSLADAARTAHRALGLAHFSRADFVLTPRGPYLLEVNAIPGLYPGASFPAMLESVGSSVREFLSHSVDLARG